MDTLTWNELKEKIEKMSEEQRNKKIFVTGEDMYFVEVFLQKSNENMYIADNWDCSVSESDLDDDDRNSPGFYKIMDKGTYFLNVY